MNEPSDGGVLKLPPIPNPHRYAGLYVYDFGTHVAVGYTAGEVAILQTSEEHHNGLAYEIYRVGNDDTMELRAAKMHRVTASESLRFLRHDASVSRSDYDALIQAAKNDAPPCTVELHLAKVYAIDPPNVMTVTYPVSASTAMSGWLTRHAPAAGDEVESGRGASTSISAMEGVRIASCTLDMHVTNQDRSVEEVLAAVRLPLQR